MSGPGDTEPGLQPQRQAASDGDDETKKAPQCGAFLMHVEGDRNPVATTIARSVFTA
jgi:hypothetical protein